MEEQKVPKAEKPSGGGSNPVWKFFTSLKLTVVLLIILALVSIIGTIVDQTEPEKNIKMLVSMFGPDNAPGALDWLIRLGLTNMYHSWWFVSLLLMISSNITICTIDRLPGVWRKVTTAQKPLTDDTLKTLSQKREIRSKTDAASLGEKAKSAIKSMGYSPKVETTDGVLQVYAEKGRYSRLGVYITHASILVIFMGALAGSFWGYKGYLQISEGQTVDSVPLMNKPLLMKVGDSMPLGFKLRCDKFELKTYESGMPSNYLSTLTVLDGDKEVLTKTIRVNDPLEHNSIRFYQSSYGTSPEMAAMIIRATPRDGKSGISEYSLRQGQKVQIKDSPYSMQISQMAPDVVMGPNNQLVQESGQFKGSAAANIMFFDSAGNQVDSATIMNMDPSLQPHRIPYVFNIMDYRGPYYTGLQVGYDPGVWVVWAGCTLMVMGIMVAFFMFHKRVWITIKDGGKGQSVITVAGSSNKNRHAFEREFQRLLEKVEGK